MPLPHSWTATAFNPVPESENRIHSDEIAREYGFRGGLVPGVVVSAYLLHPAATAWGRSWLERGSASVVVHSPVYDGEDFRVELSEASDSAYQAALIDERGVRCATARVSLPSEAPDPPTRRGKTMLSRDADRPVASRSVMEGLRARGLSALAASWSESAEITSYLRSPSEMAAVFCEEGLANPGFILGLTNWVFGQNVKMSPWLHLQTDSQHFRAIEPDTELVVEAAISDLFEKKGHEFADVEVAVFRRSDDVAVASVRLRAIYLLREP
jgi:hypothetical protein